MEWEQLPAREQEQNRDAVRDIPSKSREIGCEVVVLRADIVPSILTADEVKQLSEREHGCWAHVKLRGCWRWAEERDNATLRHPATLAWAAPPAQVGARYPFTPDGLPSLGRPHGRESQAVAFASSACAGSEAGRHASARTTRLGITQPRRLSRP